MTGRRRRGRRGRGFPSGRAPPAPSRPRGSIATPRAASRGPPRPRRGPSSPDKIYPSEKRGVPALGPRPRPFFPPRQTVSRAHRGRAAPALLPLPLGGPCQAPVPSRGGGEGGREGGRGGEREGGRGGEREGGPEAGPRSRFGELRPRSEALDFALPQGRSSGLPFPQNPCGPRRAQERRGDDRAAGKGRGEGPWPAGHARAGRPSSAVAACGRPGRPFSPGAKYLPRGANSDGACAGPPPRDP